MHRSVDGKDVIDYSTGARKRDIQLQKEEDIEYRNGVLRHSSGNTMFKVEGRNGIEEAQSGQEKEFSDVFSAHGSYTLDLQQCYTPSKQDGARQKRSLNDEMNRNRMSEERLTANFNISKYHKSASTVTICIVIIYCYVLFIIITALNARRRVLAIREAIPSVTTALTRLNKNPENRKLSKFTLMSTKYVPITLKFITPQYGTWTFCLSSSTNMELLNNIDQLLRMS